MTNMATVGVGSLFSIIKFLFSFNVFTLVSWISVIGLVFKFLRKEYVMSDLLKLFVVDLEWFGVGGWKEC